MSNISFYITWNQKIFFTRNQNYHYYYLYSGVIHLFIQSWIGPIILVLQLVCSLEVVLSSHCYTSFGWEYRDYVNGYFTESMTAERLSLRTTKYRINSDKSLLTIIYRYPYTTWKIKEINSFVIINSHFLGSVICKNEMSLNCHLVQCPKCTILEVYLAHTYVKYHYYCVHIIMIYVV